MPQFKKTSNKQKFWLPSTKDLPEADRAWVELELGDITAGDVVEAAEDDASNAQIGLNMLASRITDWNFTDESGNKVPIDVEHCALLDIADFSFLGEKLSMEKRLAAVKGLAAGPKGN